MFSMRANPFHTNRLVSLRPYQGDFESSVMSEFDSFGKDRVIAVLPTGGGKTTCAGAVAERFIQRKGRVLMLAHARKLVGQFRDSLERDYEIWGEIEMGEHSADLAAPLICGTVQSLANRIAKKVFKPNHFDLVVVDEAHRVLGETYKSVAKHFSKSKWLGLTATPRRGDQKDLMTFFQSKAIDIPLNKLINDGFLAPLKIKNIPISISLSHQGAGDFSDEEVAHAIEPYLDRIADEMVVIAKDKCSLIFLPLIATSKLFCHKLTERGMTGRHVDGSMDEMEVKEIISQLERGEIQFICNSMLLTEGVDIRPVNMILNLRPTRSWTLYTQICGRGTRLFGLKEIAQVKGGTRWGVKTDCTLVDPMYLCEHHNLLQRPSCLVSSSDDEAKEIDEKIKGGGGEIDLMKAKSDVTNDRQESLRKRLEEVAKRKERLVDAMELFMAAGKFDMADYEPISDWESAPVTSTQRDLFMKQGVDLDTIKCYGHAAEVVKQLHERAKAGLCTLPQAKYAASLGMQNPMARSFEEVSRFISAKKQGIDLYDGLPD